MEEIKDEGNKIYILNKKEIEFIKNSDDPGFYSWLITDMGGKVKSEPEPSKPNEFIKRILWRNK